MNLNRLSEMNRIEHIVFIIYIKIVYLYLKKIKSLKYNIGLL